MIAMFLLLVIPFRPLPVDPHPYQHPRLVAYHEGRLVYADVDERGVIVGHREIQP